MFEEGNYEKKHKVTKVFLEIGLLIFFNLGGTSLGLVIHVVFYLLCCVRIPPFFIQST